MKRAYSPKEIAAKKWVTLPWGEKWSKPFGEPADNASWFISGASASGKSSFVMQLAKELCKYGPVLYMSYEEGVNQSFQRRMDYLGMAEVQGRFRVVTDDSYDELVERLRKPKSPKFIIVDSFQVAVDDAGFSYEKAVELMKRFPKKCFIYISQEDKSQPTGKPARRLKYICDMKVRVMGYKAYCQGRAIGEAGTYYVVWKEGLIQTSNNL
jgi:adenosyl cobinamide kinase/adenosyl cobinamide phosphate guanylyltransferase